MKTKHLLPALVLAVALLALPAYAGTVTAVPSTTAASGSSAVLGIDGPYRWNVQACVTAFAGTINVWTGETAAGLSLKHTWTITTNTSCDHHYSFDPTGFVQIRWTRTAGTIDSVTIRDFGAPK